MLTRTRYNPREFSLSEQVDTIYWASRAASVPAVYKLSQRALLFRIPLLRVLFSCEQILATNNPAAAAAVANIDARARELTNGRAATSCERPRRPQIIPAELDRARLRAESPRGARRSCRLS